MRNYYFLASERINSFYNQLATRTPIEIITKQSNKEGTHTEGKLGAEGGLSVFAKGTGGVSRSANKENTFEENIHSSIELEQKLDAIEKSFNFILLEQALAQSSIAVGLPIHFKGGFYSKGLKNQDYYSSNEWDKVTLPLLYKNLGGRIIKIPFHPSHLISNSAWSNLHGRVTIDGIGFVEGYVNQEIMIAPLGFGIFVSDELDSLLG